MKDIINLISALLYIPLAVYRKLFTDYYKDI